MREHKFTRRLALILLVAALLMSLPLVSACAKYVRELYAGSFTLTIQPQGNSHSQDVDQTPIQDADRGPSRTINKSPSRRLFPFLIQNPARERLGRRRQDETRGAGIGRRSRAWRSCALASGGCWAS